MSHTIRHAAAATDSKPVDGCLCIISRQPKKREKYNCQTATLSCQATQGSPVQTLLHTFNAALLRSDSCVPIHNATQIVAFGSISAMFNPAAALSQVVAGNLSARQFFTVIAGEMAGAILGGLTVYLLYMPQIYKAGAKVRAVSAMIWLLLAFAQAIHLGTALVRSWDIDWRWSMLVLP
jgi:hypothetical protein